MESQEPLEQPNLILCIFPHLREFLVVNLNPKVSGSKPVQIVRTEEIFTKQFFLEVEQSFAEELHDTETPFANLMSLPQHVELIVRHHSVSAVLEYLDLEAQDTDLAVFLIAGPVLTMDDIQLTQTFKRLMGASTSPITIMDCVQEAARLLIEERDIARQLEAEQAEEAIIEEGTTFLSLWEARN